MLLNNTQIKGQAMNVTCALVIDTQELGAQSSSTARAEKGFKPKKLTVNLRIRYVDAVHLTRLIALAESTDRSGRATVYDIVDPTARAMKVRQVTFIDNVRVSEEAGSQSWTVSFMLAEYQSIAEKKEQRHVINEVIQQTGLGSLLTPVKADSTQPATATTDQPPLQLTDFEAVLKTIEEAIQ